ncbi:MAG: hypothetical protein FD129_475 [bacterium]|nr:MAG: hypothetical protein FD129_475 [bacterium]
MLKVVLVLAILLVPTAAGGVATPKPPAWDGQVQVHGTFRAMFHEGKVGSVVSLDSLTPNPTLYGVGALADLAGEVTIVGGTAYLAYPVSPDSARTDTTAVSAAGATLLVTADVPAWRAVRIDTSIVFEAMNDRIMALAAAAGMDVDTRFPFRLTGEFEDLEWHVVDGRLLKAGGTSHEDHLAASTRKSMARATGSLIGFYSNHDERVFTHMGSYTHVHCALDRPLASGHVDHVTIPAGALIWFPVGVDSADRKPR